MVIIILFIILFLLFVPLPIKLGFIISKTDYIVKFYRFTLFSKQGGIINKFLSKKSNSKKGSNSSNSKIVKKKASKPLDIKKMVMNLMKNKFKPSIRLKINGLYSTGDASNTALLFGLINSLIYAIYLMLTSFFRIKKFKIDILPVYTENIRYEMSGDCIITVNLSQIILMLLLILKSHKSHN